MPADIASRADIDALMVRFYNRAMIDPVIGHHFDELDLDHHLPIIGDFWETILFGAGVYARHGRHPLMVHRELDRKSPLEPHHFERWLAIFHACVDEMFAGIRAEFAKQRGHAIANRMQEFIAAEAR